MPETSGSIRSNKIKSGLVLANFSSASRPSLAVSIVKHVCKNHGGEVKVWSSLGVGSTFAIRLPIVKEKVEQ